jgi:hypothetical protein
MDLAAIGQQFGLTEEQTRAAFDALTPVVASGVRRSAQSPTGLQDILSSALNGNQNLDAASGNEILGQIFGSKDVSRGVAQQLSATSGIGAAVLKQLLPIIASIVMGQVAKKMGGGGQSSGGGGLGDILGDILGGGSQQQRQQPQSGGGGLGDILKDVLGGGGQQQAPQTQGGSLEDMLKDILGGGAQPETVNHGRKRLDDVLGGGTQRGTDADILLDSVTRSVRR